MSETCLFTICLFKMFIFFKKTINKTFEKVTNTFDILKLENKTKKKNIKESYQGRMQGAATAANAAPRNG